MLSKDVCKNCWNTQSPRHNWDCHWDKNDETRWTKGEFYCCIPFDDEDSTKMKITDAPPAECPYKFEHAVAAGIVNIDKKE